MKKAPFLGCFNWLGWLTILVKGKARDKSKNESIEYNQETGKAEP